jgi:hypothetical protein
MHVAGSSCMEASKVASSNLGGDIVERFCCLKTVYFERETSSAWSFGTHTWMQHHVDIFVLAHIEIFIPRGIVLNGCLIGYT